MKIAQQQSRPGQVQFDTMLARAQLRTRGQQMLHLTQSSMLLFVDMFFLIFESPAKRRLFIFREFDELLLLSTVLYESDLKIEQKGYNVKAYKNNKNPNF
jgi:hypothetical protein